MSFIHKLSKIKQFIKSDLYRYSGEISLKSFIVTYLYEPGFNYLVYFRIRSEINLKLIGYVLYKKRIKFGIDIPAAVKIGEGFYIGHYGLIFINSKAVIGKNCNISHGVTIGQANTGTNKGVPTIGDRVYIAPGAKIMGNIKVGNDVAIGANSVVASDVPDNAVIVGIPGRVVSFNGSRGYINNVLNF